jgi:alkylated DNA repair protein (DNA oxidative demethylase)
VFAKRLSAMPSSTLPLFPPPIPDGRRDALAPGAWVLRGFALDAAPGLLADIARVAAHAPFRHLVTRGGHTISVAMTNCGDVGWWSDRRGYRYTPIDPLTGRGWPPLPRGFLQLARAAADAAGFPCYGPDVCHNNRYAIGTRLTLHRDYDERDRRAPIVSVSLGLPATFLWGGLARTDRPRRVPLEHGDVVVWGGPSRLVYHGVLPIRADRHPDTDEYRLNLTFRVAHGVAGSPPAH